jgi:hypothetical protein
LVIEFLPIAQNQCRHAQFQLAKSGGANRPIGTGQLRIDKHGLPSGKKMRWREIEYEGLLPLPKARGISSAEASVQARKDQKTE